VPSDESCPLPTGAVHGFCRMLNKLLREMKKEEAPTHLAVICDKSDSVAEDEKRKRDQKGEAKENPGQPQDGSKAVRRGGRSGSSVIRS
jgi:hypothetical protein